MSTCRFLLFLFFFFLLFPLDEEEVPYQASCSAAERGSPAWTLARSRATASSTFLRLSSSSKAFFVSMGVLEEDLEGGVVDGFACHAGQQRHGQRRRRGSHVTVRDCPTPRLRLRRETQPLPRRWSLLVPWHVVRLALHLLLGPGCLRSPWGGVVRSFSQGHSDGHPLVAMPLTEPSLSSPHCGARSSVFAMHQHVDHYKARKINKMRQPV